MTSMLNPVLLSSVVLNVVNKFIIIPEVLKQKFCENALEDNSYQVYSSTVNIPYSKRRGGILVIYSLDS